VKNLDGHDGDSVVASLLLGRPARVVARLSGGVHAVTTTITDGAGEYVLRRFPPGDDAVTQKLPGTPPSPGLGTATIAVQLGAVLARIHTIDGAGLEPGAPTPAEGDSPIARRARRDWVDLDRSERVLSHGDFWCGNTLWDGDKVTGVVDWFGANRRGMGRELRRHRSSRANQLGSTQSARRLDRGTAQPQLNQADGRLPA
jgi:hypothetical protein